MAVINLAILGSCLFIVLTNQDQNINRSTAALTQSVTSVANPLDQLSSADIAASIASQTNLAEATAVKNQAETVQAELAIAPAENVVQDKPQIVASALKSRFDIQQYTTVPGDTVSSVAAKFNVTSNSISFSNNLSSSTTTLPTGLKLLIPPINGMVYTVKAGDTAQSLASAYSANAGQITAFNDAEISGLQTGEQIVIPNGQKATANPFAITSYAFNASYGGNGYDFGYCTWYVANQVSVPNNWGNASSWAYYASLSGWTVSSKPVAGAIAQTPYAAGGQGHVGIVKGVSADGSQVLIEDMNGIAGWDRVGEAWLSTSEFPNYISH